VSLDEGAAAAAEPDEQHRLLSLQDLDTLADQLAARRRSLPERAAVIALEARAAELRAARAGRAAARQKLVDEQDRLEAELAAADARDRDLASRLRAIFVTREAEAVMAEQRALTVRRSDLEDLILERMGEVAGLDEEDAAEEQVAAALAVEAEAAGGALAVAERAVDEQLADVAARRTALLPTLPEAAVARYEALRRSHAGVAVARLEGGRCLGCHLTLSTRELDRIRHEPADAIVECENCGRLLVR
jgi:predicted  nucleic acid-binding Zn-ribbon protein